MPSSTPSPEPLDIVTPGQPSPALLNRLKTVGKSIDAKRIARSVAEVETKRAGFTVAAIETGLLLLAKKQTLKHGQFGKFAAEIWKHAHGGGANGKVETAVSTLEGDELKNFTRSLRHYTFLAQHFLADLEQQHFAPDWRDQQVLPPAVATEEVAALATLPHSRLMAVRETIHGFVAGRSLRRMLTDFRRAEKAADQEAADEEASNGKPPAPPPPPNDQLDFWEDLKRPLSEIDTLCNAPDTLKHAPKAFWENLAQALQTQADRAKQRAQEVAA